MYKTNCNKEFLVYAYVNKVKVKLSYVHTEHTDEWSYSFLCQC